ncbi:hypothetical protein ACFSLT_23250 [Novosphingobium resinovorum]
MARGAFEAAIHYLGNNSNVWIDAEVERAVQEPLIIKRIGDYAVALRVAESLLRDAAELYDAYNAKGRPSDLDDELILAVAAARVKTDEAALLISSDMFSLLGPVPRTASSTSTASGPTFASTPRMIRSAGACIT